MFKKIILVLAISFVYLSANAAEDEMKKPIWIMVKGGLMQPVGSTVSYDNSYTVGGIIGAQITRFFGLEAGVDYSPWDSTKMNGVVKAEPNFSTTDIKVHVLFQPMINISDSVLLLPHVGAGAAYSFHGSSKQYFGYTIKGGLRVVISKFIIGASVEYVDRRAKNVSYSGEIGVAF